MTTKRQRMILLTMRRERIQQLVSRGYSQRDISKELCVSLGLVNQDISFIRKQAKKNMEHYISVALPEEMDNSLIRLRDLIREAWKDIADTTITKRDKYTAIQVVKECTALRLEILGSGIYTNQLNKAQEAEEQQQEALTNNEARHIPTKNTAAKVSY